MKKIFLYIIAIIASVNLYAYTGLNYAHTTTEGTQFYVTWMMNSGNQVDDQNLVLNLYVGSTIDTEVHLYYYNSGGNKILIGNYPIKGDTISCISLENNKNNVYSVAETQRAYTGVYLESSTPISLYAGNQGSSSYDATLVLPTTALGNEYIVQTYSEDRFATELAIVGTSNTSTTVYVTPSVRVTNPNFPENESSRVTLHEGQVLFLRSEAARSDLSGTLIYSDKPVAVFNGNQSAWIPYNTGYSDDHIFEQSIPLQYWGKEFAITKSELQDFNYVRVTAGYDGTQLYRNGIPEGTALNRGETRQITVNKSTLSMWLTASKPVACFLYLSSAGQNDPHYAPDDINQETKIYYGDPSMVYIPPMAQAINHLVFAPFPHEQSQVHFVNVVVPTSATNSLTLDGHSISIPFTPLTGNNNYSYVCIPISDSISHILHTNVGGFTAYVYGIDQSESYAYNAGFNNIFNKWWFSIGGGGWGGYGGGGGGSGGGWGGGSGTSGSFRQPARLNDITICLNEDSLIFSPDATADYHVISWDFGDGTVVDSVNSVIKHKYEAIGDYTVKMRVEYNLSTWPNNTAVDEISMHVHVVDTYKYSKRVRACIGDGVIHFGTWEIDVDTLQLFHEYQFVDSAYTMAGCDSITTYHMYVGRPDTMRITEEVWPAELPYTSAYFKNNDPKTAKFRYLTSSICDTVVTECKTSGCDSVIIYTLNVKPGVVEYMVDTTCFGSNYVWDKQAVSNDLKLDDTLSITEIPTDTLGILHLRATNMRDSIWNLSLLVAPIYANHTEIRMCDVDTIQWQNRLYVGPKCEIEFDESLFDRVMHLNIGQNEDDTTYMSQYKCDSTLYLTIDVLSTDTIFKEYSICGNDPFDFFGTTLSYDTILADTTIFLSGSQISMQGCDSIVKLKLNVHPHYSFIEFDTVPQNSDYQWRGHEGRTIWLDGHHVSTIPTATSGQLVLIDSLNSQFGCDSVWTLNLTVAEVYAFYTDKHICDNDTFTWQQITYVGEHFEGDLDNPYSCQYVSSGVYDTIVNYSSILGSDSTFYLSLSVHPTARVVDYQTICDNEPFSFAGVDYDFSDWHKDTTIVINGVFATSYECDSLVELHLTIHQTYFHIEDTTICGSEIFDWRTYTNLNYKPSGIYYDTLTTRYGCDSVFAIDLTILPGFIQVTERDVCTHQTVDFHGHVISYTAGETSHMEEISYPTGNGCDSIYRMIVHWQPAVYERDTITLYNHNAYEWHNMSLTGDGLFVDVHPGEEECDSIYELFIIRKDLYLFTDSIVQCGIEPYYWRGKTYSETGVYQDKFESVDGMDSIYQLKLFMYPSYFSTQKISLCPGQSLTYKDKLLTPPIIYNDTMLTINGCDSILQLVVVENPTYLFEETNHFPEGQSFEWRGRDISTPGVYWDSLQTVSGCDSIYKLTLTRDSQFYHKEQYTICQNNPLLWHGSYYDTTGIYYDKYKDVQGVDSIYELDLIVLPSVDDTIHVSICEGETFTYKGITYVNSTIIEDSTINSFGCDVVHRIILQVHPSYHFDEYGVLTDGESYSWRNRTITTPGMHYDSCTTIYGCDSVYALHLSAQTKLLVVEHATICAGDAYLWEKNGKTYSDSGTYFYTRENWTPSDSIFQLDLVVLPSYLSKIEITTCGTDTFRYKGQTLTAPMVYNDTLRAINGCDSIFQIILNVGTEYLFEQHEHFMEGTAFEWRGYSLTTPGVYWDRYASISGCDSVYKLVLTRDNLFYHKDQYTICHNEPLLWHGNYYDTTGVYYDKYKDTQGVDSIYELDLVVLPSVDDTVLVSICEGDTFTYKDVAYSNSVVIEDSTINSYGCDIKRTIILQVYPSYHFDEYGVLTDGATYNWRGQVITIPGMHYNTYPTIHGCDSVYALHLSARPELLVVDNVTINYGETYQWYRNNHTYSERGTYYYTQDNWSEQDTLYQLNLHLNYYFYDTISLCSKDPYTYHERVFRQSGTYFVNYKTVDNCDSIYYLNIHFAEYEFKDTIINICQDEVPFHWNGKSYMHLGSYLDSLVVITDCDTSVTRYHININPTYHYVIVDTINDIFEYNFRNKSLRQSGIYIDTIPTVSGCDSIWELDLTVLETPIYTVVDSLCAGQRYVVEQHSYGTTGVYYDTIVDVPNKRAYIHELKLLVKHPTRITNLYCTEVCEDSYLSYLNYEYIGDQPLSYSLRFDDQAHEQGFIDISNIPIEDVIPIVIPQSMEDGYLRPNYYHLEIQLDNGVCDDENWAPTTILVHYPNWIIEQNFSDVVATLNPQYNGGYAFSRYAWYVNNRLVAGATGSNLYYPNLSVGDEVVLLATRQDDGVAISTCPLVIVDNDKLVAWQYPVLATVSPLRVSRHNPTTNIVVSEDAQYCVYDACGRMIHKANLVSDDDNMCNLPPVTGLYYISIQSVNRSQTIKVMVE